MKLLITILILLFIVLQYRLWIGEGSLPEVWQLEQKLEQQKKENAQLKERNQVLEAEVQDLKQGLDALEERARNDLGMIKENEVFYQLVTESENKSNTVDDQTHSEVDNRIER